MMWAWQLYLGAAAFALVPVVNALTTHAHLGITLRNGDWVLAGFDLSMIAFGAMLALCGWRMQHWTPPLSAAEKKKRAAAAGAPKAPVEAADAAEAEASA